jgi:hypothetical protein
MIENHDHKGWWWLPEDESTQLPGTLTVTKGAASLELMGNFGHQVLAETETEIHLSAGLAERKRIVGFSTEGKEITLEGHRSADYVEHFPGIPVATYTRYVTLIGKSFAANEKIVFDEISIKASDLNAWTQTMGISTAALPNKQLGVTFDVPDDIEIALARGERAFIRFTGQSQGGARTSKLALSQDAEIHLRFRRRTSLDEVFVRASQIRNFLSFAIGRPVTIISVTGYDDDHLNEHTKKPIPIQLLWQVPHNPDPPARPRQPQDVFFTLPEASPDISTVMKSWFAKQGRLAPVFNLFFGMQYHPDMYSDVRFLAFAQAVETYDYRRRRKPGGWTLAQRTAAVLARCQTVSNKIVGKSAADRAAFIQLFKDSRNYYTHYNPKLETKAAKGASLALLTVQLQAIIEMSLLRELGFTIGAIDQIFTRMNRYLQIDSIRQYIAEGDTSPW